MFNKTVILVLIYVFVLSGIVLAAPVERQAVVVRQPEISRKNIIINAPRLTLVVPKTGEDYSTAGAFTVKWTYSGDVGTAVKIELLKGGNYVQDIAANVPAGTNGTGGYYWALPKNLATAADYQIRVTSLGEGKCTAVGGKFSIYNSGDRIKLTSPGAGTWANGAKLIIGWEFTNNINSGVTLYLIKDNQRIAEIGRANTMGGKGSMTWAVPADLAEGGYQIRVIGDAWQGLNEISPYFTVKKGALAEGLPNNSATNRLSDALNSGKFEQFPAKQAPGALKSGNAAIKLPLEITTGQIAAVGKSTDKLQITTDKIVAVGKPVNTVKPGAAEINTVSIIGIGKQVDSIEITTDKIIAVGK